jgi:hypothetical protein
MLPCGFARLFTKQSDRLPYACLMVSFSSVFCTQSFPHKFIELAMNLLERLSG